MSASEASAVTAVAFQLLAALDSYEVELDRLVIGGLVASMYQAAGAHVDRMRMYASSIPGLSASSVEVMIRHVELMQGLWRRQRGEVDAAEIRCLHENQKHSIASLRDKSRRLICQPDVAAAPQGATDPDR